MATRAGKVLILFAIILLLIFAACTLQVREGSAVVVTRFGRPVRTITATGLAWKLPWPLESVLRIDMRKRVYETRFAETMTRDKKNVILLSYVVWRVDERDPLKFLQAVIDPVNAESKLDGLVANAKNNVLGDYLLSAAWDDTGAAGSGARSILGEQDVIEEIEHDILAQVAPQAGRELGIVIEYIGLKRFALPEENTRQVFQQMRQERAKVAATYRAEGARQAEDIVSQATLERAEILAEAQQEAIEIRGAAEAEAARTYAAAHEEDPEFYRFLRSLESLRKTMGSRTMIVATTSKPPFDVLQFDPNGELSDEPELLFPFPDGNTAEGEGDGN